MIEIPKEWLGNNDYFVMRTNKKYIFPTAYQSSIKIKNNCIVIVERNAAIYIGDIVVYENNTNIEIKRWNKTDKDKKYKLLGKVKYIINEI